MLIDQLEKRREDQTILSHAYDAALGKLQEYVKKIRRNSIYTIAMSESLYYPSLKHSAFFSYLSDGQIVFSQ
jgi:hypothetical protein